MHAIALEPALHSLECSSSPLRPQLARNGDVLVAVCDRDMTHPSDYLTTWVRQVCKNSGIGVAGSTPKWHVIE
jgi:hypothetical protein